MPQVTGVLAWQRNNERPQSGDRHYNGSVVLEQQLLTFDVAITRVEQAT